MIFIKDALDKYYKQLGIPIRCTHAVRCTVAIKMLNNPDSSLSEIQNALDAVIRKCIQLIQNKKSLEVLSV